MKEIDARGKPCPQPVLLTKKAVDAGETDFNVIVDNAGSADNIVRFVEKQGLKVSREQRGDDFVLLIRSSKAGATSKPASTTADTELEDIQCPAVSAKVSVGQVLLITSDRVGKGDEELGAILAEGLLNTLAENENLPQAVVLINAGVKLACEGSNVLGSLITIEDKGVEVLACGTCLNFFGIADKLKVGKVSNAYEILNRLLNAERVVNF